MPLLRFILALALYGILGVVGIAVTAYGAMFVIGSAYFLIQGADAIRQSSDGPSIGFLVQHYGLYGGITGIGITCIVISVILIMRRFAAGLPGDDEGVGKSPASRFMNILLYGAGFAFAAFSLAVSVGPGTDMALRVATGTTVEAKVLGFDTTAVPDVYSMRYSFRASNGQTVAGAFPTERTGIVPTTRLIPSVPVTYRPENPTDHVVSYGYSHSSFVFFVVTRLAIGLVGMWGLIKNIAPVVPKGEQPKPTPEAPRPLSRPAAPMDVAGQRRATFGRRGA